MRFPPIFFDASYFDIYDAPYFEALYFDIYRCASTIFEAPLVLIFYRCASNFEALSCFDII
jgi:hypothetical protein